MSLEKIREIEQEIVGLTERLNALQKEHRGGEVPNYQFSTSYGEIKLLDLFGEKKHLLVIHNMGQGCRYCTVWADGFNGFLPHLEQAMSVVLVSRDDPETQRRFANERKWRFRMASHGGGDYIREQTTMEGSDNMPGAVLYEREGDLIYRKNDGVFGPGDQYCSLWNLLALAGQGTEEFTPQFSYWKRPEKMDDGGANLPD
ncbi:MAG: DUF899 family protein [Candidatus Krumholzibacteria bacterium]|jgi:predicted dithiol-disulfide oxidoreductase (DUF899 family)|nr:DUF899 family protein [Candidatus Krumholzibacteria bacterium]MDP6668829.1 DUF899 family protein [Candidatus Krumholzibacteria bacterium]MDP6796391.1 DUF899 family protein [Candidatus Krumholzibacteria bacterium]MDP7022026.1 DUF899 family protein [Candidatus Krumholzibacteria bacterium]